MEGEKSDELQSVRSNSEYHAPVDDGSREKLIQTAISFLQNPKVKESPLSHKKSFLEGKGLTTDEVKMALERAGCSNDDTMVVMPPNGYHQNTYNVAQNHPAPISTLSKVQGFCTMILVTGGTVYGIYQFTKKYVIPYIYGLPTDEERLRNMEKQMTDFQVNINETMAQLQHTLRDLQTTLQQIYRRLDMQQHIPPNIDIQFKELRAEITSLKGLLLNKHQFPAAPTINRVIPAWQMDTTGGADVANGGDSTPEVQDKKDEPDASSC